MGELNLHIVRIAVNIIITYFTGLYSVTYLIIYFSNARFEVFTVAKVYVKVSGL